MEKQYFKGDLHNFITELYKYSDAGTINKLISNINRLFLIEAKMENNLAEIQYLINEILQDLFTCFRTKLRSIDNKFERLKMLTSTNWCGTISFLNQKTYNKNEFKLLDENIYNEAMHELFYDNLKK